MTNRDQIFSGVKEVDEKLQIDKSSLNNFLKNLLGNKIIINDIKQFKGGQSNPTYLISTNEKDLVP